MGSPAHQQAHVTSGGSGRVFKHLEFFIWDINGPNPRKCLMCMLNAMFSIQVRLTLTHYFM